MTDHLGHGRLRTASVTFTKVVCYNRRVKGLIYNSVLSYHFKTTIIILLLSSRSSDSDCLPSSSRQ